MQNDTPVYHANAYNHVTGQFDIWVGTGTLEAIEKRGLKPALQELLYCPKEWLTEGWRSRP